MAAQNAIHNARFCLDVTNADYHYPPFSSVSFQPAASKGLVGPGASASDFSKTRVMREKMSTGTGKTTVVFFSTLAWIHKQTRNGQMADCD
jgi:hypothetical protein